MQEINDTIFTHYGNYFSSPYIKKTSIMPFKDDAQFPFVVDILSRKYQHHLILQTDFSISILTLFLNALLLHLSQTCAPKILQTAELTFIDTEQACITCMQESLEKNFNALEDTLNTTEKYLLIALTSGAILFKTPQNIQETKLQQRLKQLVSHPRCRILAVINKQEKTYIHNEFSHLTLSSLTEADIFSILKYERVELENFHHVSITDEILTLAYSLTER